jgi:hypothetical protein
MVSYWESMSNFKNATWVTNPVAAMLVMENLLCCLCNVQKEIQIANPMSNVPNNNDVSTTSLYSL